MDLHGPGWFFQRMISGMIFQGSVFSKYWIVSVIRLFLDLDDIGIVSFCICINPCKSVLICVQTLAVLYSFVFICAHLCTSIGCFVFIRAIRVISAIRVRLFPPGVRFKYL